ncbi:MAG: hypothetical protein HN428_09585, partial [Proteobacteria bacterium]|nr:hypothetical protein [Pseudomonadota bacterium]
MPSYSAPLRDMQFV